jgi:hypothetical protein
MAARRRKLRRARKPGAKRVLRPRNPLALPTRRLGRRVKPSVKRYRRRPKHQGEEES